MWKNDYHYYAMLYWCGPLEQYIALNYNDFDTPLNIKK